MKWAPTLPFGAPGCAVIPGRGRDDKGFVVTGNSQRGVDPRVDISVTAVEEMAKLIGWVPEEEVARRDMEILELRQQAELAEAERDELGRQFDAIDVLASKGYQARKKPGRPRVEA